MLLEKLEELLLNISYKEEDVILAESSFNLIYREYSKFVRNVIVSHLKNSSIYDEDLANAVLNNTFLTVFEKPLYFSAPNDAKDDKCFKAWISTIAKNELKSQIDMMTPSEKRLSDLNLDESDFELEDVEPEVYNSSNHKILKDALNKLKDRDRDIVLTHYLYYEEGKNMPSDVLDSLCLIHSTTRPNLRQVMSRSEKKIIDFITKNSQLKPLKDAK